MGRPLNGCRPRFFNALLLTLKVEHVIPGGIPEYVAMSVVENNLDAAHVKDTGGAPHRDDQSFAMRKISSESYREGATIGSI